jgi:DNA-binding transcriptional LysR family regulator
VDGLLLISAPRLAIDWGLTSVLAQLASLHPRLKVELHADDRFDGIAADFDAGILLGEAVPPEMSAMRLSGPFKIILVAAPAYVKARGVPTTIDDLQDHQNCIGFCMSGSGVHNWVLMNGGKPVQVKPSGTAVVSDSAHARDLALAGVGIAQVFQPLVQDDLRSRRLKWLLPQHSFELDGLFLYYPRCASLPPKLRAFAEVAKTVFAQKYCVTALVNGAWLPEKAARQCDSTRGPEAAR